MPHSPVGICNRECKEIFPQFFIFTVKRDIRFFRPFTEGIWRRDMYVGVGSWAKSSAATESMSEQCTGWHHPINHLSTLQRLQPSLLTAYLQKNTGRGRHHKGVVFRSTWSWCTDQCAPLQLIAFISFFLGSLHLWQKLVLFQDQFCHHVLLSQNPLFLYPTAPAPALFAPAMLFTIIFQSTAYTLDLQRNTHS